MPPHLSLSSLQATLERIAVDERYHDALSMFKTARNGAVYGTKVRFPHALVMIFLFRSGTFRQKLSLVLRATRKHASNLARFALIYKSVILALRHLTPATPAASPSKKPHPRPLDPFIAGLIGGYLVFGQASPRTGRVSSVNQQIVIYIFARVCLALARLAVQPGHGLPVVSAPVMSERIRASAWPLFASLSWATVMLLFNYHPDLLQSSLRSSMMYIYSDCDEWDSLRTLLWHNK